MQQVSVLFVCLGNICRSPSAEGVFRALVEAQGLAETIHIDSAGTGAWHIGQPPDPRAVEAALERGIDLRTLRGRQAKPGDFDRFDYVLAMDRDNYHTLARMATEEQREKLHLFLDFAEGVSETEVPDPYYEGGFAYVLDLIENASKGLLTHLRGRHG